MAAAALAFLAALIPAAPVAAQSVQIEVLPAGEELFAAAPEGGAPVPAPEAGRCLVVGRYSGFSAGNLGQITVLAPDGRQLPLVVETPSVFVEFGSTVAAMRFGFLAGVEEADSGRPFTLQWGPEVKAANSSVERIVADPARRGLYRTFRPLAAAGRGIAIPVIADRSARYHFVWYLVPMGLVFLVLTLRKARSRAEGS